MTRAFHKRQKLAPHVSVASPKRFAVRRIAAATAFAAVLIGVGALADALTITSAASAGAILTVAGIIQAIRPRREAPAIGRVDSRALVGAALRGGLWGIACTALIAVLSPFAGLLPSSGDWTDYDRPSVEQQIEILATAGNDSAAADVIVDRLKSPISAGWRSELQRRHVELLVLAGEKTDDPAAKTGYWRQAVAAADEYDIDRRLPQLLLDNIAADASHQQTLTELRQQRQQQLQSLVGAISEISQPIARDAVLRTIEQYVPEVYQPTGLSQAIVDNLLKWAEATRPLNERAERLRTVIAEATKRSLDPKLAQLQLASVEQELERQAPVIIPAGISAQLKAVHGESRPAMAYDVAVANAAGQTMEHLDGKDFVVRDAKQRGVLCEVIRSVHATGNDLSVVLLLDYSPSTELVRNFANSGVAALTSAAPRETQFRVLAFHDDVVAVTDWTDRFADIDSRLRAFKTSGSRTSLRRAMTVGVAELANRSGTRLLVLFTDGKETTGELINDAELIAACREKSIRVMTIGLENPDLDVGLLSGLAAGTGGTYYAASRQEELVDQFRSLQLKQTIPVYRVALLATPAMDWPLELTIGRGPHAVRMSLPLASSRR